MDFILWRHAQAYSLKTEEFSLEADLQRQLTLKGEAQAQKMAAWLNARLPESTKILVSPARRSQQTAQALGRPFETVFELNPQGTVEDILLAAQWPHHPDPVLIVGHQPILGWVASRLLCAVDQPWTIKKAAIWWLRYRIREGVGQVVLLAALTPDFI